MEYLDRRQTVDSDQDRLLEMAEETASEDLDPQVFHAIDGQKAPEHFARMHGISIEKFTRALTELQGLGLEQVVETLETYRREQPQFCAAVTDLIQFRKVEKRKAYEPLIKEIRNHDVNESLSFLEMIRFFNTEFVTRYLRRYQGGEEDESKRIARFQEKAKKKYPENSFDAKIFIDFQITMDATPFSLEEVLGSQIRNSIATLLDITEKGMCRNGDTMPRLQTPEKDLILTPIEHHRDLGRDSIAVYDAGFNRYRKIEEGVRVIHSAVFWLLDDKKNTGFLFNLSDKESDYFKEYSSLKVTPYSRPLGGNGKRILKVSGESREFSHLSAVVRFIKENV